MSGIKSCSDKEKKRKLMKYEKLPESAAETPQQAVNTVG